jgi:hypothetical protein
MLTSAFFSGNHLLSLSEASLKSRSGEGQGSFVSALSHNQARRQARAALTQTTCSGAVGLSGSLRNRGVDRDHRGLRRPRGGLRRRMGARLFLITQKHVLQGAHLCGQTLKLCCELPELAS